MSQKKMGRTSQHQNDDTIHELYLPRRFKGSEMEVRPVTVKGEYATSRGPHSRHSNYSPSPPVLTEHYVPRTHVDQDEHADRYSPRITDKNELGKTEQYERRANEPASRYSPRETNIKERSPERYSPRPTEQHVERYVSRSRDKVEHYNSRKDHYIVRTPDSSEPPPPRYMPRTPTHYVVRQPTYYPNPPNPDDNSMIVLHPLIIGKDVVICMPEVNKVLRHVYQVLSQANYYLSKHGISSRRYTGAQLIRIKMLGILGHEAKVCSYILMKDAERVFDSFDVSGDCHKSPNITWMDPVLLDEKPIPELVRKSPDLSPATEHVHEGPVTVYLFKLDGEVIICAPDVQKVVQANFHQGATVGYYFTKLGIVPHKFLHTSHLDKVKELGIIKRSAVHCTYIMKSDAMSVFEAYGMSQTQIKDKVIFSDVIELMEGTSSKWKPPHISKKEPSPTFVKTENSNISPPMLSPKKERYSPNTNGPNGVLVSNLLPPLQSSGRATPGTPTPTGDAPALDDDELKAIPSDQTNDFTVNVFVVEGDEVVCMPDIHKIVQAIHGNSIQVNYYFNKLRVVKKRFCFAHLRELKAKGILQNNATYCTYVPRADAEKLFQIYCLVDDPKLKEIIWSEPINLEAKHIDESQRSSTDMKNSDEDVTVHTFKIENNVVITVPDVHKIVDFLDEQSASLDYHFRKLGIMKCRFTYSQLHQLRRLNVIKRPTVCTYVTRTDMDKLLSMYETERNRSKMERLKFLEPIPLISSSVASNAQHHKEKFEGRSPLRYEDYIETPPEGQHMFPPPPPDNLTFVKPGPPQHNEIMSPNSAAISYIQNAHPAIDCPIVIPNGDYDPTKVNEENGSETINGKRAHYDSPEQMSKKLKYAPNPTYQGFINDINRKEDELRFLHDAYQREIEEERNKRVAVELKYEEALGQVNLLTELKAKLASKETEIFKCKEDLKNERIHRERTERGAKTLEENLDKERALRERVERENKALEAELNERRQRDSNERELANSSEEYSSEGPTSELGELETNGYSSEAQPTTPTSIIPSMQSKMMMNALV